MHYRGFFMIKKFLVVLSVFVFSSSLYAGTFSCAEIVALLNANCRTRDENAYKKYEVRSYTELYEDDKRIFVREAKKCFERGALCKNADSIIEQQIIPLYNAGLPANETMRIGAIDGAAQFSFTDSLREAVVAATNDSFAQDLVSKIPSREFAQKQGDKLHQTTKEIYGFIQTQPMNLVLNVIRQLDQKAGAIPDYTLYCAAYVFAQRLRSEKPAQAFQFNNSHFRRIFKQAQEVLAGKMDMDSIDLPDDSRVINLRQRKDSKWEIAVAGSAAFTFVMDSSPAFALPEITVSLVAPTATTTAMLASGAGIAAVAAGSYWLLNNAILSSNSSMQATLFNLSDTSRELLQNMSHGVAAYEAAHAYKGIDPLYDALLEETTDISLLYELSNIGAKLASQTKVKTETAKRSKTLPSTCRYNGSAKTSFDTSAVLLQDLWDKYLNKNDRGTAGQVELIFYELSKSQFCKKSGKEYHCGKKTIRDVLRYGQGGLATKRAKEDLEEIQVALKAAQSFTSVNGDNTLYTRLVWFTQEGLIGTWVPYPEIPLVFTKFEEMKAFFSKFPKTLTREISNWPLQTLKEQFVSIASRMTGKTGSAWWRIGLDEFNGISKKGIPDWFPDGGRRMLEDENKYGVRVFRHIHYEEIQSMPEAPSVYVCNHALYYPSDFKENF